jgi:hypothetical protein
MDDNAQLPVTSILNSPRFLAACVFYASRARSLGDVEWGY